MEGASTSNASLIPSAKDLLLVVPRLAQRAGSFALLHMPEAVEDFAGMIFHGGSIIADATGQKMTANSTITNTSAAFARSTAAVLDPAIREAWSQGSEETSSMFGMVLQSVGKLKNLGGIFSYLTSRWALATFTAAIVLNRTQFYASSREHLRPRWSVRLAIYMIPILAFLVQMQYILQAMRCQTSPDFSQLRYGDPLREMHMDFGGEGGFLYQLASTLLWWQDDATCCAKRSMSLPFLDNDQSQLRGSMSLLFWFFITLCTSQLFETLSCALQGRQPVPETGMTIFEHSLAFAECEAMISSALGFGFFGLPKFDAGSGSTSPESSGILMARSEIVQRLNVPPEVLLVCLISCFSHLSSATLAVVGLRDKVRLVNTGIWACCYMSAFLWSFLRVFMHPIESITDLGVLRFPTVCIVGFIPHVLIMLGILLCSLIYGLALLLTALSVPEDAAHGLSFQQRLHWAYQNLQANVQFSQSSAIRVKMSEDFYTTLLKIGFNVLTAASEAVYLNEGMRIQVANTTWLERKRLDELAISVERRKGPAVPAELLGDEIAKGVDFIDQQNLTIGQSPYARERRSKPRTGDAERQNAVEIDSGLGLTQRRSRMQLTFDFVTGIFWLSVGLQANLVLGALRRLGIERRPAWLLKAAGVADNKQRTSAPLREADADQLQDFLLLSPDGRMIRPSDDDVDVEVELRRRYQHTGEYDGEDHLSERVYSWWRGGGWFGERDDSGDFEPRSMDDDATSVVSMSTNASAADEWSDMDESGRRTPTQRDPLGRVSRESTPAADAGLDMGLLSRLLNPQSTAEREEARLLSYGLRSPQPLTRGRFRRVLDHQRAELLRGPVPAVSSAEEEEHELERFILAQRTKLGHNHGPSGTWESGAEGMGAGGPQCVVCQSTPRTILVWPCGCLSMCDDCRVGLAARNYTKCICCRTDIAAYSRLYVP